MLDVISNADIHRAYLFTGPAVVAFLGITGDLQEGKPARHFQESGYGASVFAEGTVIPQCQGHGDGNNAVKDVTCRQPIQFG